MDEVCDSSDAVARMRACLFATESDDPDVTIDAEDQFGLLHEQRAEGRAARFRRLLGTANELQTREENVVLVNNGTNISAENEENKEDSATDLELSLSKVVPTWAPFRNEQDNNTGPSTSCPKLSVEDVLNLGDDVELTVEQAQAIIPVIVGFCHAEKILTGSIPTQFVKLLADNQDAYDDLAMEQKRQVEVTSDYRRLEPSHPRSRSQTFSIAAGARG